VAKRTAGVSKKETIVTSVWYTMSKKIADVSFVVERNDVLSHEGTGVRSFVLLQNGCYRSERVRS